MRNIAFHNDPALAEMVRSQVHAHAKADEIVQGKYWENGKGCFIGCIAHSDSVSTVEDLTGFPDMLTRIAEGIFEGLPNEKAKEFPVAILNAVRPGADLSLVSWKFLHWLIDDILKEHGNDAVRAACSPALQIVSDKSKGIEVTAYTARAAADAADATYASHAFYAYARHAPYADARAFRADDAAHAAADERLWSWRQHGPSWAWRTWARWLCSTYAACPQPGHDCYREYTRRALGTSTCK